MTKPEHTAPRDSEWGMAMEKYLLARQQREAAAAEEESWKNILKEMCMAMEMEVVVVPGMGRVAYTEGTHRSFDIQRFKDEHPGIDLTPWYRQTATRTLRVTAAGGTNGN